MGFAQIKIEATISGEIQTVWTAWTLPEHITRWNFASEDWCCPWATNELTQGGRYVARMEAKDGSFGFDFEAIYDEVIPLKRIAMTLGDGRKVTTTFQTMGSSTRVTTIFDAETQHSEDLQRDGWQSILNNFKKYVEAH
jgi:uncharacterized protein YndB with AHSA1/START domain